ncbi:MAG: PH domain-containing protein [Eubacterium sp.]|nr:PH domain-containing protein [Eubacterium sp.]
MDEYVEKKRWLFFGLPFTFTTYTINKKKINVRKGLLNTTEDDTLLYRVTDVKLVRSLFEKMAGLGTVVCYSADSTDPALHLTHIKNSSAIKEFILEESEEERRRIRTLHTMGLNSPAGDVDDVDGVDMF